MITLGYIKSIDYSDMRIIKVRIPIFEKAGIGEEAVFDARLVHEPGSMNGYVRGDCVAVGFLDNVMDTPIILGKLFTGMESESSNFSNANSLTVTNSATLPTNTTIGGIRFDVLLGKLSGIDDIKEFAQQHDGSAATDVEIIR
jgi:hypothetical protein